MSRPENTDVLTRLAAKIMMDIEQSDTLVEYLSNAVPAAEPKLRLLEDQHMKHCMEIIKRVSGNRP